MRRPAGFLGCAHVGLVVSKQTCQWSYEARRADVVIDRGQCYRPGSGACMGVRAASNAWLMVRTLQA